MMASSTVSFDLAELLIRPVEQGDRADIRQIASQIWDGHDYLDKVFPDWLADPRGVFCAGVYRGRVIATAKLTAFEAGVWWMEGLRVDPAYRGQGVARRMHRHLVETAAQYAPGEVRYSTASSNEAVDRLSDEMGFRLVSRLAPYGIEADTGSDGVPDRLVALTPADYDRAWAFIVAHPNYAAAYRSIEEHWRYYPLTSDLLRERLAAGRVYGWLADDHTALAGIVILNAPRRTKDDDDESVARLYAGYLDAKTADIPRVGQALRLLAAAHGLDRVSLKVPVDSEIATGLAQVGYTRQWENHVMLYARDLTTVLRD
jgi:ribosomal protein S18 acetylase RimI-like enzyme